MILKYFLLLALVCGVCRAEFPYDYYDGDGDTWNMEVLMPKVRPTEDDQYICASQRVAGDLNIVNFIPKASMSVVHHMLLFGCESVHRSYLDGFNRGCNFGECTDGRSILFAWARDAPPPAIPRDVGFHIGGDSGINYLTLQIHYGSAAPFAHDETDSSGLILAVTTTEQAFLGGIFLNVGMNINISPDDLNSHTDIACEYNSPVNIYAFAFRTHSHNLGKVISGYRIRNHKWTEIAKGNPLWPQAFYPMNQTYEIKSGDIVATRCTYDGTRTDHMVHVGATHNDEMCNLYIMYYTDSVSGESYKVCGSAPPRGLFANIPPGWDRPPERMPRVSGEDLDEDEGHSQPDVDEPLDQHNHHGDDGISAMEDQLKTNVQDKIDQITDEQQENRNSGTTATPGSAEKENDTPGERVLNEVPDWGRGLSIGQVGGLAMDRKDNVHVFHRAERTWDADSFDSKFYFLKVNEGPIKNDTILTLDKDTGAVIDRWGANQFYMPHGLFVDHKSNVWVTDVALHQVFKYPPGGAKNPSLSLGVRLMPGSDSTHFCQPADVVVDSKTGNFFVADGYCNSRIMKYSPEGTLLLIIDNTAIGHLTPSTMTIVHSLTLANDSKHICATDRENGRVLCFDAKTGKFLRQIKPEEFESRVYAAVYSPHRGGVLFAINGPTFSQKPILGVTVNYNTVKALETWSPEQGFAMPHDLAVSSDANYVYVGEIGPNRLWKFVDPVPPKETNVKNALPDGELARDSLLSHEKVVKSPPKDVGATMVIVVVLAVPIILMMVIAVVVRLHAQGKLRSGRGMFVVGKGRKYANDSFSIGNFFNRKKGFTQVSTDDSDQEGTTWSEESDVEEYSILNSKPTQNL